jgi:tetratricopeptide (TPR) repeat protein
MARYSAAAKTAHVPPPRRNHDEYPVWGQFLRRTCFHFVVIFAVAAFAAPLALTAEKAGLGDVHFPISCKAGVQSSFDHGLALLHSFEFREAEEAFRAVENADPKCVIAAWGIALATTERSGAKAPQKDLAKGWAEFRPWLAIPAGTEREQMYVNAVRAMYEGYDQTPGDDRWHKYLDRMQEIRQRYPDDVNASLFYALGLTWTAGPGKQGIQQRKEALAIFLPIFNQYPDNPGAAHYIIHAADTSELAAEALPAARKYAAIAPDSPHALHMPSHIFNRLGYWKDSIATNQASARIAAEWAKNGGDGRFDELHALNNMEYAYLQLGQDSQAQQVIQQIGEVAKTGSDRWLAIDARIYFDLETHDWKDAEKIEPPSNSGFDENFDAYWIATIAAARSGNREKAERSLALYRKSSAAWDKEHGWGDVLGVALTEAQAWTMFSEGKRDKAVTHLRGIAQYERDHPMYYADILPRPTGEMLGDMLLQMGRPAEALVAYKQALELAPNRLDSLVGAKAAAAASGNIKLSQEYAGKIVAEGGLLRPGT